MDDDALELIREAERTIYHTQWRIWEELALEHLACTQGLARAPLVPGSDVIQLVTWDGEHLGHVRRDGQCSSGERWVAVLKTAGADLRALWQRSGRRSRPGPGLR
jgi:hypothetical protein